MLSLDLFGPGVAPGKSLILPLVTEKLAVRSQTQTETLLRSRLGNDTVRRPGLTPIHCHWLSVSLQAQPCRNTTRTTFGASSDEVRRRTVSSADADPVD